MQKNLTNEPGRMQDQTPQVDHSSPDASVVSVLIPVYNVEQFVTEALESIQKQSLQNIEIIVVNDGSTDRTLQIVQDLALRDRRIRVLNTPRNLGIAGALNLGLTECRATYIARMDGDDVAMPTRLEKQVAVLETNRQLSVVGTAALTMDECGRVIGILQPVSQAKSIRNVVAFAPPCFHPTVLIRRSALVSLSGYRMLAPAEDLDLLQRMVTSGFGISNVSEPLLKYRIVRPGNTAATSQLKQLKANRYICGLYKMRIARGVDNFTREAFELALQTTPWERRSFALAQRFMAYARGTRIKAAKCFLWLLAGLASPWQARAMLSVLRGRMVLRSEQRIAGN